MTETVHNQGMHAWVSGENLKTRTRRRVAVKYNRDVFFDVIEHVDIMP
jgi:hypothetical protein